ncbi:ABC transporter ATP-binding protein, partial [Nocardia sp. NPDC058519]|uniref:ABC transporter ATP-binding protein n=1 Tax=Nocardia sp. NPDC058519 TaxID=3346535 RepID=UPI00364C614D
MIDIDNVRWTYAGSDAPTLDGFDLRIAPGETVVLCGASGSGKSTALRLMNGLVPHFHQGTLEGSVQVDGQVLAELALDRIGRFTGTVLQHPRRQFFTDTAETELAFALENFGTAPAQIRERVATVIDEHELTPVLGRRLNQLSGGQQQQVASGAAISHQPRFVLLDEPTSNLSTEAIERFTATVRRLRATGTTIVIAEHRLDYLRDIADRVVLVADGRVAGQWSGTQFYGLPGEMLASEGLRVATVPGTSPTVRAQGPSIAASADAPAPRDAPGLTLHDLRCSLG